MNGTHLPDVVKAVTQPNTVVQRDLQQRIAEEGGVMFDCTV